MSRLNLRAALFDYEVRVTLDDGQCFEFRKFCEPDAVRDLAAKLASRLDCEVEVALVNRETLETVFEFEGPLGKEVA